MSDVFKINHNGVDITYNEKEDKWEFELRGRNRSAESLTKAKEAIDKPVPAKEEPFKRMDAILLHDWRDNDIEQVTVTSIAERSRRASESDMVWVMDKGGNRSKEAIHYLYVVNDANKAKLKQREDLQKQIEKMEEERKSILKSMEKIKLPKEGDNA